MFKQLWKWILLCLIVLTLISLIGLHYWEPTTPLLEITEARRQIFNAKKVNASKYASALLEKANMHYDSAMVEWHNQNKKIVFLRNFSKAYEYSDSAKSHAIGAINLSLSTSKELKKDIARKMTAFDKRLKDYSQLYALVPLGDKLINEFVKSKMLHQEGAQAFYSGNYRVALEKMTTAEEDLDRIIQYSKNTLESYFEAHPDWVSWSAQTIELSKRNKTTCVLVDKFAREALVYKNGTLIQKYDIELGTNWIGNKNSQGDKSTPEGLYKIIEKKQGAQTKYYKALLLNYPNEEDKKRFALNKQLGQIRSNAKIGGLIEIHGNGGKGADWTEGCIALPDQLMDKLYATCSVGTPVTIVGSLIPLHQLTKSKK